MNMPFLFLGRSINKSYSGIKKEYFSNPSFINKIFQQAASPRIFINQANKKD